MNTVDVKPVTQEKKGYELQMPDPAKGFRQLGKPLADSFFQGADFAWCFFLYEEEQREGKDGPPDADGQEGNPDSLGDDLG